MKPTARLSGIQRVLGRLRQALRDSRGLINTTDLMVASGAAIILAAGVAAVATDGMDQARYGKAQPDAVSLATAMNRFFADTGKWPGQVEILADVAATGKRYLATGDASKTGALPEGITTFAHEDAAACGGNSGTGAVDKDFAAIATRPRRTSSISTTSS